MPAIQKKPLGAAITGFVFTIIGLIVLCAYSVEYEANFFDFIADVSGPMEIILITYLILFATFFIRNYLVGTILFRIAAFGPILFAIIRFDDVYHSDLEEIFEYLEMEHEFYITWGIYEIFNCVLPFIAAILLILGFSIRCRSSAGWTAPLYIFAGVLTFFYIISFVCYFNWFDYENIPSYEQDYILLNDVSTYLSAIIPYWVIAILMPLYSRRKPQAVAIPVAEAVVPVAEAPVVPTPIAPVMPTPVVPVTPVAVTPVPVTPVPVTPVPVTPTPVAPAPVAPAAAPTQKTPAEALAEIKALLDSGIISEAEFNARRENILKNM